MPDSIVNKNCSNGNACGTILIRVIESTAIMKTG
jgi:hypothetical protein